MSFQMALSGLNGSANALDHIGNNIANSNTVGFKRSDLLFADVYASAVGNRQPLGTSTPVAVQRFTQGGIQGTNNPFDIAINGNGLFRLSSTINGTDAYYSRNGEFQPLLKENGTQTNLYLTNADGYFLTGWGDGVAPTAATVAPLVLGSFDTATDSSPVMQANPTTASNMQMNFDSRSNTPVTAVFDPNTPSSYNFSTSQTVYDAEGAAHNLMYYFAANPAPLSWSVYARLDGVTPAEEAGGAAQLTFDALGQTTGATTFTSTFAGIPGATLSPITSDFASTTQYAIDFGVLSTTQDGYGKGSLRDITISPKGVVQSNYSNGRSLTMGTIALGNFASLEGLQAMGNNLWAETHASGPVTLGTPQGTNGMGGVKSSALEVSNVDLSNELVSMIIQQRAYQANAQAVKTQDSLLGTLSSLR